MRTSTIESLAGITLAAYCEERGRDDVRAALADLCDASPAVVCRTVGPSAPQRPAASVAARLLDALGATADEVARVEEVIPGTRTRHEQLPPGWRLGVMLRRERMARGLSPEEAAAEVPAGHRDAPRWHHLGAWWEALEAGEVPPPAAISGAPLYPLAASRWAAWERSHSHDPIRSAGWSIDLAVERASRDAGRPISGAHLRRLGGTHHNRDRVEQRRLGWR